MGKHLIDRRHLVGRISGLREALGIMDQVSATYDDPRMQASIAAAMDRVNAACEYCRQPCDLPPVHMDGDTLVIEDGDYTHEIGFCTRNNGDSWYWALRVPKHVAKGRVREIWDALNRPDGYHHGPGGSYADRCIMYFEGGCLCFKQSGGLDI